MEEKEKYIGEAKLPEEAKKKLTFKLKGLCVNGNIVEKKCFVQEDPSFDIFRPLVNNLFGNNRVARGRNLYDGKTNPQQQFQQTPVGYAYAYPQGFNTLSLPPFNAEAFYSSNNTSNNQAVMEMVNSMQDQLYAYQESEKQRQLAEQKAAEQQRRRDGMNLFLAMANSMNQVEDNTPYSYMSRMLTMMPNTSARGGSHCPWHLQSKKDVSRRERSLDESTKGA